MTKIETPTITKEKVALYRSNICAFLEEQYIIVYNDIEQLIVLDDWQRKILTDIFHTYDSDGRRLYTKAVVGLPRKNYKSTTLSGVALWSMLFDRKQHPRVFSAAGAKEQAALIFTDTTRAIQRNASFDIDQGGVLTYPRKSYRSNTPIACPDNGGEYKVVSADAGLQHGLNPTVFIFDELHVQKDHDLWEAAVTAFGSRRGELKAQNPLLLAITTAGYKMYEKTGGRKTVCYEQFCEGKAIFYKRQFLNDKKFIIHEFDEPHLDKDDKLLLDGFKNGNPEAERVLKEHVQRDRRRYFFWTYDNLANVPQEYLDEQRHELGGRGYQIFHENRWVGGAGTLLSEEHVSAIFNNNLVQKNEGEDGIIYCGAIDIGTVLDSMVVSIVHYEKNRKKFVVDHIKIWSPDSDGEGSDKKGRKRIKISQAEEYIIKVCEDFGISSMSGSFVYDPTQFIRSVEELEEYDIPLVEWSRSQKGSQEVSKMIHDLCVNGQLECFHNEELKAELYGLEEVVKGYGTKIDHSSDSHNDIITTIALAAKEALELSKDDIVEDDDAVMCIHFPSLG